jgi:outer membrane protein OmpA-like peptidoglycan-associated protein
MLQAALAVAVLSLTTVLVVGPALARLPSSRPSPDRPGTSSALVARSATMRWNLGETSDMGRLACVAKGLPRFEVALLWAGREDRISAPDDGGPSPDKADALGRTLALADTLQGRLGQCDLSQPDGPDVDAGHEPTESEVTGEEPISVSNVVHFAFDHADVEGLSAAVLDSVAAAMLDVPDVLVELVGHTDVRGPSEYNVLLGERRAEAVRRYLVDRGVAAERIQARSRGEEDTYRPNARTNQDHALNRRVEIRFVTPGATRIRVHRQDRDLKFAQSQHSLPSELAHGVSPRPLDVSAGQATGTSDARSLLGPQDLRAAATPGSLALSGPWPLPTDGEPASGERAAAPRNRTAVLDRWSLARVD